MVSDKVASACIHVAMYGTAHALSLDDIRRGTNSKFTGIQS